MKNLYDMEIDAFCACVNVLMGMPEYMELDAAIAKARELADGYDTATLHAAEHAAREAE